MPARHGDHVEEGLDAAAVAGQDGGMNRVAVQHRLHLRPIGKYVGMQGSFRRRPPLRAARLTSHQLLSRKIQRHQIARLHQLIGQ